MTATAGPAVINDICSTLQIPFEDYESNGPQSKSQVEENKLESNGVKVLDCHRDNIDVSVLFVNNENERLHKVNVEVSL